MEFHLKASRKDCGHVWIPKILLTIIKLEADHHDLMVFEETYLLLREALLHRYGRSPAMVERRQDLIKAFTHLEESPKYRSHQDIWQKGLKKAPVIGLSPSTFVE